MSGVAAGARLLGGEGVGMAAVVRRFLVASALLLAAASAPARAADAADAQVGRSGAEGQASRPKRTVLHFEDDSIRGDLTRPDGELVQAPRRVAEGSLVRLRRSFTDRALASVVRGE